MQWNKLKRKLRCQVLYAQSSQICVLRKCNWYFIVNPKEGNTGEHAEEDRLGLSPEPALDRPANTNMLCVVQRTWHDGVKQRAATASYASLGEIEITQTGLWHCQECLLSEKSDTYKEKYAQKQWFGLYQVLILRPHLCVHTKTSVG